MWKRHNPFYLAAAAGVLELIFSLVFVPRIAYVAAANAFFVVYLVLSMVKVQKLTPEYLRRNAARSDEPVWIIFAVTLGTVIVAVSSLFVLINSGEDPHPLDLSLALAAVPLGWLTVHMMAAIHYAHLYLAAGLRPQRAQSRRPANMSAAWTSRATMSPAGMIFFTSRTSSA